MEKEPEEVSKINTILSKAITAVEESKEEIFEITENLRKECDELQRQVIRFKEEAKNLVLQVESLEEKERISRKTLLKVSKNFETYAEEDIKKAYERANDLRLQVLVKRREEKEIITKRKDLELRLKEAEKNLKKAESLTSKIGIALEFLGDNFDSVISSAEGIEEKQAIGKRIILAQEEERKRIARDIHDGPAQSLSNVIIKSELCERLLDKDLVEAKEELKSLKEIVRESTKEVRRIIYNLRPMSLDDLGFVAMIEKYLEVFQEESGIQAEFVVDSNQGIEDSVRNLFVFRITQELLNNVRKHSEATFVEVSLDITKNSIHLRVQDNGKGFNMEEEFEDPRGIKESPNTHMNGLGLQSIKERVKLLNGRITFESKEAMGTKVQCVIPNDV
ncbi:sensor histidine kinase [Isachenkonia alkalipeptolytica]|uniref:Oxygen sensor histidine kinase NreB n=1 Tax=Isachenkonia alkalipeptolytica TaxID=2565777 RepID=A0AA44BEU6_9CLOT|nr:sensor histidine kinase [Isachenkonia alkalipeptolytica]NBG87911.1 sensor histidine kinase [Isachenkonia alkalipeptolytica]